MVNPRWWVRPSKKYAHLNWINVLAEKKIRNKKQLSKIIETTNQEFISCKLCLIFHHVTNRPTLLAASIQWFFTAIWMCQPNPQMFKHWHKTHRKFQPNDQLHLFNKQSPKKAPRNHLLRVLLGPRKYMKRLRFFEWVDIHQFLSLTTNDWINSRENATLRQSNTYRH